jgi:hypothetical protein
MPTWNSAGWSAVLIHLKGGIGTDGRARSKSRHALRASSSSAPALRTSCAKSAMTARDRPGAAKKRPERTETSKDRKPLPLDAAARVKGRVVLAVVLVGLALWTAASFLPALIWATILAVSLWPLYMSFAKRFGSGPA